MVKIVQDYDELLKGCRLNGSCEQRAETRDAVNRVQANERLWSDSRRTRDGGNAQATEGL